MEEEIKTTDSWQLYEKGKNYNNLNNVYTEGKENYDYYHGKQWEGLKRPKQSSEPIVLNIVKPIIKYKTNIVNQNDYAIVFNPNTYEDEQELEMLQSETKGLNQFVMKMWEKSQSGKKVKNIDCTDQYITSCGIIFPHVRRTDFLRHRKKKQAGPEPFCRYCRSIGTGSACRHLLFGYQRIPSRMFAPLSRRRAQL